VGIALLVVGANALDADRARERRLLAADDSAVEIDEAPVDRAEQVGRVGDLEADRRVDGVDGPRPGRDELCADGDGRHWLFLSLAGILEPSTILPSES
jgi:hypothetical protein